MKKLPAILIAGGVISVVLLFLQWMHHTFVTGLNPFMGIISIVVAILLAIPIVLWGMKKMKGQWAPWMLFAAGCLCWMIRALVGGWKDRPTFDIHLHDTYYVIAHVHVMGFIIFLMAIFAAIYYRLEASGRGPNNWFGFVHFWVTFIGCYYFFWPWHYEGPAGMPRRYVDFSSSWNFYSGWNIYNGSRLFDDVMMMGLVVMGIVQVVFVGVIVYIRVEKLSRIP